MVILINYVLPQGLVIVPPTDHNGELKLNVTAIAQDGTASTLQSSASTLSFTLLAQSESAEVDIIFPQRRIPLLQLIELPRQMRMVR